MEVLCCVLSVFGLCWEAFVHLNKYFGDWDLGELTRLDEFEQDASEEAGEIGGLYNSFDSFAELFQFFNMVLNGCWLQSMLVSPDGNSLYSV